MDDYYIASENRTTGGMDNLLFDLLGEDSPTHHGSRVWMLALVVLMGSTVLLVTLRRLNTSRATTLYEVASTDIELTTMNTTNVEAFHDD